MFGRGKKNKKKEKTMKEVLFSIKKTITFGGESRYYPLHKDSDVFGGWNTIFKVNGRTLVSVPSFTNDPTYACLSLEEAESYIEEYKQVLKDKVKSEIKAEEFLDYDNKTQNNYENEK